ncbi:hypothetical protein BOX15_Mlig001677g1, partial [Macrostomum lignano]
LSIDYDYYYSTTTTSTTTTTTTTTITATTSATTTDNLASTDRQCPVACDQGLCRRRSVTRRRQLRSSWPDWLLQITATSTALLRLRLLLLYCYYYYYYDYFYYYSTINVQPIGSAQPPVTRDWAAAAICDQTPPTAILVA